MRRLLLLCSFVAGFSGCIQTIAIRTVGGIMEYGLEAFNEESDIDLARPALASNLKLVEAMIKGDPDNAKLLLFAAQGYNAYALSFAEDDSVERARVLYLRGRDYALRILRKNTAFASALNADLESFTGVLETMGADDVPAVFWAAFGWGSYINITRTDLSAIADLSKVNAMMAFVQHRQPGYYYSGADLYLGSIYGSFPPMLGGKPEKSKECFDRAIATTKGEFLMAQIYYAKTYAVQMQDQELFTSLLSTVDAFPLDQRPDLRLVNAVAKLKARRLLARVNELF